MHHRLTERIKKKFSRSSTRPIISDGGSNSIQARPERFGLFLVGETVISPGQQFDVDIIAVHGLNGDAYTTWTHSNGTFWLQDLLPACLPGCRVYTYGYPSQIAFNSSYATVRDYSRRLLASVQNIQNQSNEVSMSQKTRRRLPLTSTWAGCAASNLHLSQSGRDCVQAGRACPKKPPELCSFYTDWNRHWSLRRKKTSGTVRSLRP